MLLYGTPRAKRIKEDLKEKVKKYFGEQHNKYIAILFFGDNSSSATYVKFKKRYGEDIGIGCKVIGQKESYPPKSPLEGGTSQNHNSGVKEIFSLISNLNTDDDCVGIMIQLPLPKELQKHKEELLSSIAPSKDIDGLGGIMSGLSAIDLIDFLPATPKAVIEVLTEYQLDNLEGKNIVIIGQSNLIGKPLVIECMKRGATVSCFNSSSNQSFLKTICKQSDIIISCTGVIHLVDENFVREDGSQIVIDVGYGHKDGKAVGDVNLEAIKDRVHAYTPLPGGIGPLTIASLFSNIFVLQDLKEKLTRIL